LFLSLCSSWAQDIVNGDRTHFGVVDNSNAAKTRPVKTGPSDPSSCTPGDMFINTETVPVLKLCTGTDVWTAAGGSTTKYYLTTTYGSTLGSGSTVYLPIGGHSGGSTEAVREVPVAGPITITAVRLRLYSALSGTPGSDLVCTFRKNGADTGFSITVPGGSPAGGYSASGSTSYTSSDLATLKCVNSTGATASLAAVQFAIQPN
jgi:hypothetical protein